MADPTTVPGLRLWLKADSIDPSVVDVSSWGNSAPGFTAEALTQATAAKMPVLQANVLNGLPGVYFNGDDGLVASGALLDLFRNLGGAAVFMVLRHESPTTTGTALAPGSVLYFSKGDATNVRTLTQVYPDTAATRDETIRTGGRRLDTDAFQEAVSANNVWPRMTWKIGTSVFDWAGASARTYLDGSLSAEAVPFQTAGLTSDTRAFAGAIGSTSDATAEFLLGTLVELLVYQQLPTTSGRSTVHSYLSDRTTLAVADYVSSTPMSTVRPSSTLAAGGWTTTAPSLHAALSDQSGATIITGSGV